MKTIKLLLLFCAVAFSNAAYSINVLDNQPKADASCPIQDTSSTGNGVRNYGCNHNGVNVVWTASVPSGCQKGGCGLIVDIHGAGMNANMQNAGSKLRYFGANALKRGGSVKYIVIQPNFTDLFDSGLDIGSVVGNAYLKELPGMEVFIDDAIESFDVNPNHIHMYGFSRGTHTVNEFYCNDTRRERYASFSMHGEILKCDVTNKPLLMTNGVFDVFTPNNPSMENQRIIRRLRVSGFKERVLRRDSNWKKPRTVTQWKWGFVPVFHKKGRHEHLRFTKGDRLFESIRHSGSGLPAAGHCLPTKNYSAFLTCYSNFNVGAKIIDFFIANPKKALTYGTSLDEAEQRWAEKKPSSYTFKVEEELCNTMLMCENFSGYVAYSVTVNNNAVTQVVSQTKGSIGQTIPAKNYDSFKAAKTMESLFDRAVSAPDTQYFTNINKSLKFDMDYGYVKQTSYYKITSFKAN